MRKLLLSMVLMLVLTVGYSYSQVSNLKVLGSTSSFNVASGDNFGWSYNVPTAGDTTLIQIWIDADQNGVLNPAVDVLWTFFNQADGDTQGQGGPPDDDHLANKSVSFQQPLGLAPAHYILLFRNHGQYATFAGTVNPLASPTFTISGTVTVPNGMSKKNIMLSMEANKDDQNSSKMFWNALTDDNGHYTIQMGSDTAGNPWSVRTNNNFIFGTAVIAPQERSNTITPLKASYTGNDFTITASSASITGKLLDDNGKGIIEGEVYFNTSNGSNINRYSPTDTAGVFKLGFLASELPQTNVNLGANIRDQQSFLTPFSLVSSISAGENITRNLRIYKANSTISGKVLIDGKTPNNMIQVTAINGDTAVYAQSWSDGSGNFTINVTNKITNYYVGISMNNMGGPQYNYSPVTAHPGDANVVLNLSTTDVKKGTPNVPEEYSLAQNYPNPFNPVTTINYSVAKDGYVSLTVYNLIGSKVATLVSGSKPAGKYSVQFDGSNFASGIYLYKLESGSFTAYKKLVLMK